MRGKQGGGLQEEAEDEESGTAAEEEEEGELEEQRSRESDLSEDEHRKDSLRRRRKEAKRLRHQRRKLDVPSLPQVEVGGKKGERAVQAAAKRERLGTPAEAPVYHSLRLFQHESQDESPQPPFGCPAHDSPSLLAGPAEGEESGLLSPQSEPATPARALPRAKEADILMQDRVEFYRLFKVPSPFRLLRLLDE